MFYCPYCGTEVELEESYCLTCGKVMTESIKKRIKQDKTFNRAWMMPIATVILCSLLLIVYAFLQNNRLEQAKELYDKGETYLAENKFENANKSFNHDLTYNPAFSQ